MIAENIQPTGSKRCSHWCQLVRSSLLEPAIRKLGVVECQHDWRKFRLRSVPKRAQLWRRVQLRSVLKCVPPPHFHFDRKRAASTSHVNGYYSQQ
jgi:hypothetical protein